MKAFALTVLSIFILGLFIYSEIGTCGDVPELKRRVPLEISKQGWKIIRYEGFAYGSWNKHGGIVYYHVCNIDNPNIQYRLDVSIWNGELQYNYGQPEILVRIKEPIE